jgi:hypothetical protein
VRSEAGEAIAGARVRVVSRGDGLGAAPPVEVRAGFDGRYRIAGIEVGRAELVAHQEGVDLGVSRAVRVSEGGSVRADFFLAEAGLLAGRAAAPEGAELEPLAVVASPMRAGLGTAQAARTLADRSGNYRLALPAGEYRVHAAPAEAARTDLRATPSFARVDAGRTARLDLVAARASEEHGLEIAVLEPGGAPSPGAVVTVSRAGDGRVALATTAGEDGRVVLAAEGLAGQPLELRARNGGRAGALEGVLAAGTRAVIRLSPGAAVHGVVRGAGARVEGFTLEIASRPAEGAWRTTDVHRFAGDLLDIGDVPAGPVRLAIRTADGRRGAADLVLAPGESRSIAIDLEPPGVVRTAR